MLVQDKMMKAHAFLSFLCCSKHMFYFCQMLAPVLSFVSTDEICFCFKDNWQECVSLPIRPVRCWLGVLLRMITTYQSMWNIIPKANWYWLVMLAFVVILCCWMDETHFTKISPVIVSILDFDTTLSLLFIPIQPPSADVCRELHTVHQKLCDFPLVSGHKVMDLSHIKLHLAQQELVINE